MSWIIAKDRYRSFLSQTSSKWKERGNSSFTAGNYDDAIEEYTAAMLLADHQTEMPTRTLPGVTWEFVLRFLFRFVYFVVLTSASLSLLYSLIEP